MSGTSSGPDPFDALAHEFAERFRRGERPALSEYTERHPELAEQIRELFPALVAMEEFDSEVRPETGPFSGGAAAVPRVLGDYRVIREIGRGGMGIVYEAVQESLGRHVALKVLPGRRSPGPDHLARFLREAKAAAGLHHTNIVPVFGVGEDAGVHYYAMQFIEGQGLDAVLAEVRRLRGDPSPGPAAAARAEDPLATSVAQGLLTGRFAEPGPRGMPGQETVRGVGPSAEPGGTGLDTSSGSTPGGAAGSTTSILGATQAHYHRSVARLGVQVAEALAYAHGHGVLHRDIKPANILLDLQGTAWVTDFGLAKAEGSDELTTPGDIVGTVRYMAPERFGGQANVRSDVYGLGLTLYEMLTTEPAFAASDRALLIDRVRHEEPTRPRKLDPRIPLDLETIVLKAIGKEPAQRYATAAELAEDLRRFLGNRPIKARPVGAVERAWRWCKRNPAPAGAIGAVAAALVFVAVISVIHATDQARATKEIRGLAASLGNERESLRKSLSESNRLLAIRNYERGQAAFEKGEIGPGMLWMIESWRSAVDAGDPAWQHTARANLAAWRPHYPRLKAVLSHKMGAGGAFSPDSRTVISSSMDGTAQLWDADSGQRIGPPLQVGGQRPSAQFSRDGKTVWTWSEGGSVLQRWDAATGEQSGPPLRHRAHLLGVVFKPDGKVVLVGSEVNADDIARLWDPVTGQPIGPPLPRHPVFSLDGRIILTPSDDGTARFWDAATGQPIGRPLRRPRGFRSAAFGPDGKTVLTGGLDGTAQLWDAATSQPLGPPMPHESEVRRVAFSPDGKTILTGCQDKEARLWDAATGQLIGLLQHQGGIISVAFSPDGKTILTGSLDGTVRLWDVNPGPPVGRVLDLPETGRVRLDRGLSPDGKVHIIYLAESIQLWDMATRQPIGTPIATPGGASQAEFSLDGKVLLTIAADQTARLWDATTGIALGPVLRMPSQFLSGALSPDGKALLFVGKDRTVWIADSGTGTIRGRTQALGGTAYAAWFSSDGQTFFTGLDNGEVRLWDAATVTPLGDPISNPGGIGTGLFSPDGKSLLINCEDGSCRLWDLATRKLRIPPMRHQSPVYGRAFSPDGKTLATGSDDKTVRLWDLATGQPIGPILRHAGRVRWVAFLDDGKTLFTRSEAVSRLFSVPPDLPDELERIAAWVEVMTGLRLDKDQGLIQVLDNATWLERREQLRRLGGPPETGPDQRLDPILFGPDPTARARSFMERKQWDAAEAAFDEGMRARPFNIAIFAERGDLYAGRGRWSKAAVYYARGVKQYPDVAPLHEQLAVTRLLAGDLPGYRAACDEMLERFKPIDDPAAAVRVAYACSLAAEAVSDLTGLIQVSERSTRWVASNERVVGAVLFRAGRLEESLERFERVHRAFEPRAWDLLFLAMIRSGLGQPSEARRLLQEADRWVLAADNAPPGREGEGAHWINLTEKPTTLLLRREAEAVVRFDPVFPADPFAVP